MVYTQMNPNVSRQPAAMQTRAERDNANIQPNTQARPQKMKALGVAQRLAGMKARFEQRLDGVLAKADAAEAKGEQAIQTMENFASNLESEINEAETVMNLLTNGAPFDGQQSGS